MQNQQSLHIHQQSERKPQHSRVEKNLLDQDDNDDNLLGNNARLYRHRSPDQDKSRDKLDNSQQKDLEQFQLLAEKKKQEKEKSEFNEDQLRLEREYKLHLKAKHMQEQQNQNILQESFHIPTPIKQQGNSDNYAQSMITPNRRMINNDELIKINQIIGPDEQFELGSIYVDEQIV